MSAPAAAQTTCVQPAVGVFGQFGPPIWFSDPAAATDFPPPLNMLNTDIGDPRWNGAWQQAYGDGSIDNGSFKALHFTSNGKRFLFVSATVNNPPIQGGASVTGNVFFLGLQNSAGTQTTLLRINLTDGTDAGTSTIKPANPSVKTFNGTMWTLNNQMWFSTRVASWVYNSGTRWTVQMNIPLTPSGMPDLTKGLDLDTGMPFKIWYEAQALTVNGTVTAWYKSPATAADVQKVAGVESYPDPSTWGTGRLATGPGDVNCPGGVSIAISDIGTIGPTNNPSISILWKANPPYPTNQLFARPLNNTAMTIPAGKIQATFRIANWGSQIGVGGTWNPVPNGSNVLSTLDIPVGTQPATFYPIVRSWQLVPGDPMLASLMAGAPSDQCLLVQLSAAGGSSLVFVNDSVRGNMSFVQTFSPYSRKAEISVVNLPPLSGSTTRDVYLHVQTVNMPAEVKPGGSPPPPQNPPQTPLNQNQPGLRDRPQLVAATARGQVLSPPSSTDALVGTYPTMIVRVFHSTNRSTIIDGVDHPLLEQQDGFGYLVTPGGEVTGWGTAIDGATPVPGAPDWYKLDVPNNGTKTITTTILALESFNLSKWLKGIQWWVWVLIIVLLLLIILFLARRRTA
jgi:hypothetical protein